MKIQRSVGIMQNFTCNLLRKLVETLAHYTPRVKEAKKMERVTEASVIFLLFNFVSKLNFH